MAREETKEGHLAPVDFVFAPNAAKKSATSKV
jgi:hypothetical protein